MTICQFRSKSDQIAVRKTIGASTSSPPRHHVTTVYLCVYIRSRFSINDAGLLFVNAQSVYASGEYNFTAIVSDGNGSRQRQDAALVSVSIRWVVFCLRQHSAPVISIPGGPLCTIRLFSSANELARDECGRSQPM